MHLLYNKINTFIMNLIRIELSLWCVERLGNYLSNILCMIKFFFWSSFSHYVTTKVVSGFYLQNRLKIIDGSLYPNPYLWDFLSPMKWARSPVGYLTTPQLLFINSFNYISRDKCFMILKISLNLITFSPKNLLV